MSVSQAALAQGQSIRPALGPKLCKSIGKVRLNVECASGKSEEIYLGFPKGDYARPPGRKGRVVVDSPDKYPDKEEVGGLIGASGGWAGGETGLLQFIEQSKEEIEKVNKNGTSSTKATGTGSVSRTGTMKKFGRKEPIYVGFGKDELELRKSGAPGRIIYDEAYKYPDKENLGPFVGAVGGFAGGEQALANFIKTGTLNIRDPREPAPPKRSTLSNLVFLATVGGGIVLAGVNDPEDNVVKQIVEKVSHDTGLQLALAVPLGVVGTLAFVATLRSTFKTLGERLKDGATALSLNVLFGLAVYLAAAAILEP